MSIVFDVIPSLEELDIVELLEKTSGLYIVLGNGLAHIRLVNGPEVALEVAGLVECKMIQGIPV